MTAPEILVESQWQRLSTDSEAMAHRSFPLRRLEGIPAYRSAGWEAKLLQLVASGYSKEEILAAQPEGRRAKVLVRLDELQVKHRLIDLANPIAPRLLRLVEIYDFAGKRSTTPKSASPAVPRAPEIPNLPSAVCGGETHSVPNHPSPGNFETSPASGSEVQMDDTARPDAERSNRRTPREQKHDSCIRNVFDWIRLHGEISLSCLRRDFPARDKKAIACDARRLEKKGLIKRAYKNGEVLYISVSNFLDRE